MTSEKLEIFYRDGNNPRRIFLSDLLYLHRVDFKEMILSGAGS